EHQVGDFAGYFFSAGWNAQCSVGASGQQAHPGNPVANVSLIFQGQCICRVEPGQVVNVVRRRDPVIGIDYVQKVRVHVVRNTLAAGFGSLFVVDFIAQVGPVELGLEVILALGGDLGGGRQLFLQIGAHLQGEQAVLLKIQFVVEPAHDA